MFILGCSLHFKTKESPAASVQKKNAAMIFCCEAPEMFHGLQDVRNLTSGARDDWIFLFLCELLL